MDSAECLRGRKLWMMGSRGRLAEESRSMKQLENFSPKGLKVLVVDDDPLCLIVLERMLKQCDYSVTTCTRVKEAISMAMEKKDRFDLVMSEVYMQDEGGFRLLEIIGLMLDLPVIMMSANAETDMVMKGITHGACDYLIKPVRMEELRNIWQHVVRRKGRESLREEYGESDHDHETKVMESSSESTSKKRKDFQNLESSTEIIDDISSLKKTRIHWTVQLHQQFVAAVNRLGIDKAVPKKIIEIMGVQGLTRENVASHLQKYRLYLKRLSGAVPEPYPVASFQAAEDGKAGGTMHVQAGGKGSHAAASSASSPGQIKGSNLGGGVNPKGCFRMGRIDPATLKSLEQYRAYEQKLAANRAQVLGGIGIVPSKQSNVGQLSDKKSTSGLLRMQSVDLSLLWKAQRDQTETETATNQKPADDSVTQTLKIPMKVEDIVGDAESCKASSSRHSRTRSMSYWPTHSFPLSTTTPKESILLEDSTSKDMQQEVDDLFDSFVEENYEMPSFPETHPHPQRSGSAGFQDTSGSVNPDSLSYSVDDIAGYLLEDILPKPT